MTGVVIGSGRVDVDIAYSHFGMFLGEGDDGVVRPSADAGPEVLVRSGGTEVLLFSAASNHTASLVVEFLDGAPDAAPSGGGDLLVERAMVAVGPGPVIVYGIADGFSANAVEATPFQGEAHMEILCAGREEVLRRQRQGDLFFTGVERWTVRLWL